MVASCAHLIEALLVLLMRPASLSLDSHLMMFPVVWYVAIEALGAVAERFDVASLS